MSCTTRRIELVVSSSSVACHRRKHSGADRSAGARNDHFSNGIAHRTEECMRCLERRTQNQYRKSSQGQSTLCETRTCSDAPLVRDSGSLTAIATMRSRKSKSPPMARQPPGAIIKSGQREKRTGTRPSLSTSPTIRGGTRASPTLPELSQPSRPFIASVVRYTTSVTASRALISTPTRLCSLLFAS